MFIFQGSGFRCAASGGFRKTRYLIRVSHGKQIQYVGLWGLECFVSAGLRVSGLGLGLIGDRFLGFSEDLDYLDPQHDLRGPCRAGWA